MDPRRRQNEPFPQIGDEIGGQSTWEWIGREPATFELGPKPGMLSPLGDAETCLR